MRQATTSRIRTSAATVALVALVGGVLAVGPPASAATNLAPNPSFELSVLEGSITGPSPIHGILIEPLLPTGWAFEGSAGFFNQADPWFDDRTAHSGNRFVQISIPASGGEPNCQGNADCEDALRTSKGEAQRAYSVDPVWRTAAPIAVQAGKTYTLRVWTQLDFVTVGTGSFAAVRWLNASLEPLKVSAKVKRIQGELDPIRTPWEKIERNVTAPPGAAFATILLGSTGELWISSLRFDDVFFG